MVIHRDYAQNHELGFAQNPTHLDDNSFVNMYLHHDGYPEWRGVQLANWIKANKNISSIREILYYDIDKDLRLVNLTDEDNRQVDDILDEAIFDIAMATKAIEKKIRKL